MAADGFRSSGGAADSYLGSLISLTSKSEIRYEGVLFNINTDEASIGLRNVRSFGTEGRRKDGPQVPAIDKVYEYIVFRGSDIKDLQVKSSPPAQPAPSVHNDPAIIQSHFTPPTAPSSLPTAPTTATQTQAQAQAQTGGSLSDFGTQIPQPGIPRTAYHNITPLYQPGANLASWNPPPPPTSNNGGLSVPMYWPGYYGPPASVQSQQQSLLQPVQGLPMQPSLQPSLAHQSIHHPNMNPSFPTGASNNSASQSLEFPPPLLQPIVNSSISTSSTVQPVQSSSLAVAPSNMMPSKPPAQAVPTVSQSTTPPLASSALSNMLEKSTVPTLIPNQPKPISSSSVPFNNLSESLSSVGGTSSSPALVTPGQFLHPGPTISPTPQIAQKDVEVVQVPSLGSSSQPSAGVPVTAAPVPVSKETQAPLLPLPSPMNGVSSHTRYANRGGRGRGRGNEFSRAVPNYTEDFDFEAMNERFKKDEVWGHLGKSISQTDDGLNLQDEDNVDPLAGDKKPVYKKDDFFDTLSCNALDRESRNGRPRFSEQMRLDTETFGDFSRNRGFRGGRGPGRGGRSRGGYHGRGYGYGGRGRGQNVYRAI
ncbi:protein decapping 5-like isoform X2 [Silene latifolia]|uniref:protein decapping 5-like isoform X2 n=1 Tax=Silene latifolia TaxID=37657 RepID=UPI003D7866DF